MPKGFNARTIKQGIKTFFSPPKRNLFVDNHPDLYHKRVWIAKRHYDAIVFLSKVNRVPRKQMLEHLLERGISQLFAEKIAENNRREIELRKKGLKMRPSYFVIKFRQWAREKGGDISKFV
jgi:hypothetical protein